MTIIISNSTTRRLSVRLSFGKKQFWQNTGTLAKKANCSSLILIFFRFWHRFKWTPYWVFCETGEFWTTLKLHCAMRISCIAVVSSIAIPDTVSLSSLQFRYRTTLIWSCWNSQCRALSVKVLWNGTVRYQSINQSINHFIVRRHDRTHTWTRKIQWNVSELETTAMPRISTQEEYST